MVVVRSIDIKSNKMLCSSLIQFISNLCHGAGKLRQMLAREDSREFFGTLRLILDQATNKVSYDETLKRADDVTQTEAESAELNELLKELKRKEFEKKDRHDISVLRGCLHSLIGNLCLEKSLRVLFAEDYQ